MIASTAWFTTEHCGYVSGNGHRYWTPSPDLASCVEVASLVGFPLKYYSRMTDDAKSCLCAASLAMRAADWLDSTAYEIGALSSGCAGYIQAQREYFSDYVINGRTLGRASLFIYTLPTSVLGEIAIPLHLTGPTMHIQAEDRPLATLLQQAEQLITDHEADGMLGLWSDLQAVVCFAVASFATPSQLTFAPELLETTPLNIARHLALLARMEPNNP